MIRLLLITIVASLLLVSPRYSIMPNRPDRIGFARAFGEAIPWTPAPNPLVPASSPPKVIRFATTTDFPPFNFIPRRDKQGKFSLIGFNIDLARALCAIERVRCTMEVMEWAKLEDALLANKVDVVIAGHELTEKLLERVKTSIPYFLTSARFASKKMSLGLKEKNADPRQWLHGAIIGVRDKTFHLKFLQNYFPEGRIQTFSNDDQMRNALTNGKISAIFGDALQLAIWLNSQASRQCCEFAGDPYFNNDYFGYGMVMIFRLDDRRLKRLFDHGLHRIQAAKTYQEIFLRYFPIAPF